MTEQEKCGIKRVRLSKKHENYQLHIDFLQSDELTKNHNSLLLCVDYYSLKLIFLNVNESGKRKTKNRRVFFF